MTIIKRVPSGITEFSTKRFLGGASLFDTWGSTWGETWGNTWKVVSPALNITKRVSGDITANHMKRVTF